MTDLDFSMISPELSDAVFGGPPPAAGEVARQLRAAGLSFPCRVFATADAAGTGRLTRAKTLRLHRGLTYVFLPASGSTAHADALLRGEIVRCRDAADWLAAVQRAITTLRQRELTDDRRQRSIADEDEARRVLLARLRRGRDWQPSLNVWLDTVLRRHRGHLNTVRRKQVQLLSELTAPVDMAVGLGHPFHAALRRIYSTFAFPEMKLMMSEVLADVLPFVIEPSVATGSTRRVVDAALAMIRERFTEPISLSDVAAGVGASPAHLARLFKRQTHTTVVAMLQSLRVGHARQRLAETDDTILAVALDSGFTSVEHFHRVFRRVTGESPGAYRRRINE